MKRRSSVLLSLQVQWRTDHSLVLWCRIVHLTNYFMCFYQSLAVFWIGVWFFLLQVSRIQTIVFSLIQIQVHIRKIFLSHWDSGSKIFHFYLYFCHTWCCQNVLLNIFVKLFRFNYLKYSTHGQNNKNGTLPPLFHPLITAATNSYPKTPL